MKRRNGKATPEEFVRAWQKAKSVNEVAAACGVSKQAVSMRAYLYRQRGIPLKSFPGRRPPLDVKALAKIARRP